MKCIVPAFACIVLFACNSQEQQQSEMPVTNTTSANPAPALDLSVTDSIEVLFFPDPKNQKNYTRLVLADTVAIAALRSNIVQDIVSQTECPHDVKLYFFRGGDVYKTVYGATGDSCRYFAYAINSNPYFTQMEERSFALIDSLRKKAR
jgi:hypothetical protein